MSFFKEKYNVHEMRSDVQKYQCPGDPDCWLNPDFKVYIEKKYGRNLQAIIAIVNHYFGHENMSTKERILP